MNGDVFENASIKIVLLTESDLGQVTALESDNFSAPYKREDFVEVIRNQNKYYYIAKEGTQVVGICGLVIVCGEGQLYNVSVKATNRKQGIATKLLLYALEQGSKLGVYEYTLEVRKSNMQAIHLYKTLGFQIEGERKNFYEHPIEDALIMWKR